MVLHGVSVWDAWREVCTSSVDFLHPHVDKSAILLQCKTLSAMVRDHNKFLDMSTMHIAFLEALKFTVQP